MRFDLPDPETLTTGVEPEAAIAFWAWKTAMPYDQVKRLEEGARERAFYVTGLAERDAVQVIYEAMQEALKNGETLQSFKGRSAEIIDRQGWHDNRVDTIFRNNMQTAYAAGRYAKMQEVKEFRPYWQYFIIEDGRARPTHAILNNLVYPADHEFWKTNYPPNGHKCRCGVKTLSVRQAEREGVTIQKEMPGAGVYTDPKTNMEYHVASPGADKGWDNNPAQAWKSGIDFGKYKDLTPESYPEQRLRPQQVSTYKELGESINEKCSQFVRNSSGITQFEVTNASYFLATNSRGGIKVSTRSFPTERGVFSPAVQLKDAWNKLATGNKLNWLEEYAMEGLWHEIVHNRQKYGHLGGRDTVKRQIMEIVTQWSARRTYPDFIKALGGNVTHLESIKKEGLGYGRYISNFDRLLNVLKIDEKDMLTEMTRLIDCIPRDTYQKELTTFLHEHSGIKKSVLNKALSRTKDSEWGFEYSLKELGILQEKQGPEE